MAAKIFEGKEVSKDVKSGLQERVARICAAGNAPPQLSVILVGDDPASMSYVKSKGKACGRLGIDSHTYHLPAETDPAEVLALLEKLNNDGSVSGILVQLPLPGHFDKEQVINSIDPAKDVDGLHPENAGALLKGTGVLVPCTPAGILRMLDYYHVDIGGKRAVVIGRSDIVGKPVALLLMHRHATVTICHSRTKDLEAVSREADILIAAIGRAAFVKRSFVREGAVVIDVGVNRVTREEAWESLLVPGTSYYNDFEKKGYTLVGDVDFEGASEVAGAITPVPGGVGPMTIAMLLNNTVLAYCHQKGIDFNEPG